MTRKRLVTAATRVLGANAVSYTEHHYDYQRGAGAVGGAELIGLSPHRVIKTLIVETSEGDAACVLMHGDRETSLKQLARVIGVKSVAMARPEAAQRYSGYLVGGTSPFGLRTAMPIYCEQTVAELESIVVNGGKRGFLIELAFDDLARLIEPILVNVAI